MGTNLIGVLFFPVSEHLRFPGITQQAILRLFVYGTLKRGYWNHDRF